MKKVKKEIFLVLSVLIMILIAALYEEDKISSNDIRDATNIVYENSSQEIEAYFCAVDNCTLKLLEHIYFADKIHCALYDLSLKPIIDALNQSYNEGKDVKLIVDNENYKKVSDLKFARQDTSSQLSHNKFCIFDFAPESNRNDKNEDNNKNNDEDSNEDNKNDIVLTGSFNPTRNAYVNDNNIVILQSRYIASNYEDEFNELWNGIFRKGNKVAYPVIILNSIKIENYFCPEDSCATHINTILNSANTSIYFMAFSFTNDLLANTIIMKHNDGLEVKGVYEKSQTNSNIWKEYDYITKTPVNIIPDTNKYNMHHKVFIIDNSIVVTGSFNPTKSADTKNDENVLIIHSKDIAKEFSEEFSRIFAAANVKNENI
ncbi:hypothetical protein J4206_05195 [Candidatus Woesearchaeota archaeon]|nr:hypothetical protein [Candidatus Woesearchaeota archaeon]